MRIWIFEAIQIKKRKKITQYHTRGYKKLNSLNSLVSIHMNLIEHVAEVDDYSGSAYGAALGEGAVRTNVAGLQDPAASGVVR
ncbi:hypothetical protein L2E82_50157 [Cichorium intybus]|nr:hypothetical protein L2E82_50157 [Cichorium intybus]